MSERRNLLSEGGSIVRRNKRYTVWFYILNLACAWVGAITFSKSIHTILDHSLYSDRLLHGFDLGVFFEMLTRPEMVGPSTFGAPTHVLAMIFLVATLLFMPGVLLGYASDHKISRGEFYRACGRNVWRFVRLFLCFAIIAGILTGTLFTGLNALVAAADKTSNERLPFFTQLLGTIVILVILTILRIWFDLAQTDVVLRDQSAVRKSMATAFRQTRHNLLPLLASYLVIAVIALVVLAAGIVLWNQIVPPSSVFGAFLVGQVTLLMLLVNRFWQRAVTVAFHLRVMGDPIPEQAIPLPGFATAIT